MGRVSLTEDYDDRSVISKLNEMDKRVKENTTVVTAAEASAKASAQAAQETADRFAGSVGAVVQNANAQINASKAQVDQAKAEVDAAVATVTEYDTRLTAVEVQAATNKSDISQLNVETQDLYDRDAQSVKLSADHIQTVTGGLDLRGTNTSPNTTVGEDDSVIANGHRVIQELNAYQPMVRTTGNQLIAGFKMLGISPARVNGYNASAQKVIGVNSGSVGYAMSTAYLSGEPTTDYKYYDLIRLQDENNKSLFNLRFSIGPNLQRLEAVINKKNGTSQTIVIATVDD